MKPQKLLEAVRAAVTAKDELQGIVCKYGNARSFAASPVGCFILCFSIAKTDYKKEADYASARICTRLKLCLLAPQGAGGKRLSEIALLVGEAIRESISGISVEIGEVKHNEISNTLYSDISVEEASEDKVCRVSISGVTLKNVISLKIESDELLSKKGQLLNGFVYEEKKCQGYFITLRIAEVLFRNSNGFSLQINQGAKSEVYTDCKVLGSNRELSEDGEFSFVYRLRASTCRIYENGVQNG